MNYVDIKNSFYVILSDAIQLIRYRAEQKGDLKQIYAISDMIETIPGLLKDWEEILTFESKRLDFLIGTIYSRVEDYELRFPIDGKRFSSFLISID